MPSHAHFHLLSSCSSSTYCLCCQNEIGSRALIWKKSQWEGETLAVLWLSTALFKQTKTTNISVRENIDSCNPSGHLKEYIYSFFLAKKRLECVLLCSVISPEMLLSSNGGRDFYRAECFTWCFLTLISCQMSYEQSGPVPPMWGGGWGLALLTR